MVMERMKIFFQMQVSKDLKLFTPRAIPWFKVGQVNCVRLILSMCPCPCDTFFSSFLKLVLEPQIVTLKLVLFHFRGAKLKLLLTKLLKLSLVWKLFLLLFQNMSPIIYALLACSLLPSYVQSFYPKVSFVNDNETLNQWIDASIKFDSIAWNEKEILLNFLNEYLSSFEDTKKLSNPCLKSLLYMKHGFKQRKLWTYKCKLILINM